MGKLKLHPTLLPLIVWLIITGQFSNYALLFISLCWHEFGHLVVANILGVKVKSCIIMPYGGEILYETKWQITKSQQFKIAIAGPIATLLLFGIAVFFPGNLSGPLQTTQVLLLLINLLPIWPLDGGRILEIVWSEKKSLQATKTSFLLLSMSCCLTCFIFAIWYIPRSIFFMLILILLFYQNIKAFRYRKYEQAFENVVLNRLTS
ncbi:site-2 protease family protein [Rummeliibacillus pycnus]|uniref:site-2 protease family protein n=1 Tax=Rummeliibacillus pycnus TaxID=101070 RepID=UPI0037CBA292